MSPPARWLVLTVRPPAGAPPALEDALVEVLLALGGRAVVEDAAAGALVTHLPPPDGGTGALHAFLADVRSRLEALRGGRAVTLEWGWEPHEAWEETWKEGLEPRRVGGRIVVAPSWSRPELREGDVLLVLDPGMAFGTTEHGTTRGCLRLLEGLVSPGDRVADVGTGSGILAIAAALLGAGGVLAVEADPWTVAPARANVLANGVADVVEVVEARATAASLGELGPFDGVVANIEPGTLTGLLPGFAGSVVEGGWLVLGGIPPGEREGMEAAARARGFELTGGEMDGGWWSGAFRRRAG